MRKCILSALGGAVAMFLLLVLIANTQNNRETEYEHIDYVSSIIPADCFVCSEHCPYWGEDNVGVVNLNTFELLYPPINC